MTPLQTKSSYLGPESTQSGRYVTRQYWLSQYSLIIFR